MPEPIVNLPEVDDKEEKAIEEKASERVSRKREQVKQMFVEHYKIPEDAKYLDTLIDREMASAKSFDKLIKQKKKYRDQTQTKPEEKKEDLGEEKKITNSFDRLRENEKNKATKDFLQSLVDKYPEKFKDQTAVAEGYKKIMAEYKETGDETYRDDFKKNLKKAFTLSYPDIYEEEIKEKERKRLLEDDIDMPNVTSNKTEKKKPVERKFLKGTRINPAKDWFAPKT